MKKIFTFVLGLVVALSGMAAEQQVFSDTVKVESNNLFVQPNQYFDMYMSAYGYGPVNFQGGSNSEWMVAGLFMATDSLNFYSEYPGESVYVSVYDMTNEAEEFKLTCSSFKYELTEKGDQITAIGTDTTGRAFDIKLTFFAPESAKDTVAVDFGEVKAAMYATAQNGWYLFAGNEGYQAQLFILTENLEGTYTDTDFLKDYTGVFTIQGTDTTFTGVPFDAKAEITLVDGVYRIEAELLAGNEILYQITMQYTKPIAKDTVQLSVEGVELADYTKMGLFMLQFGPEDKSYMISLGIMSSELEGTFDEKNLYYNYSFIKSGNEEVDIVDAELTTTMGEDGILTLEGWILGANNVRYEVTVKTISQTQDIEKTEVGTKAVKRIENGQIVIEKNGVKYNAQGVRIR